MGRKTSIGEMMAAVLMAAVGLTALKYASKWWSSLLFTLTVALLCTALLNAYYRRGTARACWLGFAVFGWAHLILGTGPLLEDRRGLPFFLSDVALNELQGFFARSGNAVNTFRLSSSFDYRYVAQKSGRSRSDRLGAFNSRRGVFRRRRQGQSDHEAATPPRLALCGDRAAVRPGDASGDSQSQPYPRAAEAAGRLGAIERLENVRKVPGRDAVAAILDREFDGIGHTPGADDNGCTPLAVLAGVLQEIVQQLAEQRRVRPDPGLPRGVRCDAQVGLPLMAGPAAEVVGGPGGQVEPLQVGQFGLGIGPG